MPFCIQCGKQNKDDAKFCTTCGKVQTLLQKVTTDISEVQAIKKNQPAIKNVIQQTNEIVTDYDKQFSKKSRKWLWVGAATFLLIGGCIAVYFLFFTGSPILNNKLYVLPDNLKLRSSQYDNSDANIITNAGYGTPINIISNDGEWAKVKLNNQEGYMRSKYLTNEKDFFETDAIIHSGGLGDTIKETRFKKSLLSYFRQQNYKPPFVQVTDYIRQTFLSDTSAYKSKEEWRIVESSANSNTNLRGKFNGSSKSGLGIIIEKTNDNHNNRKLLIFNYDDYENQSPVVEYAGRYQWVIFLNKLDGGTFLHNNNYKSLAYNALESFDGESIFVFEFDGQTMQRYMQPIEIGD